MAIRRKQSKAEIEEIKRLRSQHPDYKTKVEDWKFMLRAYEGGAEYVGEDTLFSHTRETNPDYTDRLRRAHYQNYCQPIVDFVPDFIFQYGIERQANKEIRAEFLSFTKNVNRAGDDAQEFMRELAEDARIFGHVWVHVDKPSLPEGAPKKVSLAEARKLDLMPYFVKILPIEILDWVADGNGKYVYLKRKQCLDTLDGKNRVAVERYTEYYTDEWFVTDVDVTDSEHPAILDQRRGPNNLGELPFVLVPHKRSKANRDFGKSCIADIAYQNRHVFNLTSLIGEFLYRQCFNILAVASESGVPTKGAPVEEEVGKSNIFEFPNQAKHAPFYLSPASDPAQFIQSERADTIQEMYRQAAQDIATELLAGSNRSGDAQRQAFGRQVPVISRFADALQVAEHKLFRLWAMMQKKEWNGKIAYKDDYSITNLQDVILQFTGIFRDCQVLSPTFVREEWIRIIREFDSKIEHDKMEKIVSEIKAIPDAKIIDLIVQPVPDQKAQAGKPARANRVQGKQQAGSTDRSRSLRTGDRSASKEAVADRNKRSKNAAA